MFMRAWERGEGTLRLCRDGSSGTFSFPRPTRDCLRSAKGSMHVSLPYIVHQAGMPHGESTTTVRGEKTWHPTFRDMTRMSMCMVKKADKEIHLGVQIHAHRWGWIGRGLQST